MKDAGVREEFCRNFGPLGNNYYFFCGKSTKCEEKLRHFQHEVLADIV